LSLEMTGKLSARLAQGMGGGLLTARLGYQAMALCRPLAFGDKNRPKLTKLHSELLAELKDFAQGEGSTVNFTQAKRNKDFTYRE
jgi:putative membrane protein